MADLDIHCFLTTNRVFLMATVGYIVLLIIIVCKVIEHVSQQYFKSIVVRHVQSLF